MPFLASYWCYSRCTFHVLIVCAFIKKREQKQHRTATKKTDKGQYINYFNIRKNRINIMIRMLFRLFPSDSALLFVKTQTSKTILQRRKNISKRNNEL